MDILLTDLNSLPQTLPQRPAAMAESDPSFNHLFREQLPVFAAADLQVVDFKYFLGEVEATLEMPPGAAPALPVEFTARFPRQQPGLIADVATAAAPAVEDAAQAPAGVLSLRIESAAGGAAEGVSLPQGGIPLPVYASVEAAVPSPALPGQAAGGLQAAAAATTSAPPTAAPITVAADARGRHAGRAPALPESALSGSPGSASAPVAMSPRAASQPIPMPVAAPDTGVDDGLAKAPRAAQAQPPLPVERQLASTASRTLLDAAASAASTTRGGTEIHPAPAPGGMPGAKHSEGAALEIPATPRGAVAVDNARQLDSRASAEFVTAASRLAPEPGAAGGEAAVRGAEMPLPTSGAQAQAGAAVALSQPAMPPVQAATPAQLTVSAESLGIARGADATDWGNAVGERVSWMINQKQNSATIRLDPPALGKLEVQVRVSDDATTITIQAQHAQTRDLIDAASVRLRDYLQESGFQNVNVDVSQRQDQQQARAQSTSSDSSSEQSDAAPEQDADAQRQEAAAYNLGAGLLDTFA